MRFPADDIVFGDISPNETTEYKEVPNGVFRYAAYTFEADGPVDGQAVIDWIGEGPLDGSHFTYALDFDPSRVNQNETIRLLKVTTDS